jgi:hypothetical protein
MPMDKAALVDLAAEYGRDTLIYQADFSTAIMDFGQIPGKDAKNEAKIFDKLPERHKFGRVNPVKGGLASGGFTQGGATRRAAANSTPVAGFYQHAMLEQDVDFNDDIVRVVEGPGGIDAAMEQIQLAGGSCARLVERALVGHRLSTVNEVEAIGLNRVVHVNVVAGLRPNMLVDRYASNGTTVVQLGMKITDVTDNGDGTGTATFESLTVATAVGELLFIAGSGGDALLTGTQRCVNLQDITNQTTILYAGLALADQPAGVLDTAGGSWSNRRGKRMNARLVRNCGEKATHLLVHPYQEQEVYESQNPTLQFRPSDTLDAYGSRFMFDKAEVVCCNNQNEDRIDFINANSYTAQVHEFWPWSPTSVNGKDGSWGKDSMIVSEDRHSLVMHLSTGVNLRVKRRDAFGAMTGLDVTL